MIPPSRFTPILLISAEDVAGCRLHPSRLVIGQIRPVVVQRAAGEVPWPLLPLGTLKKEWRDIRGRKRGCRKTFITTPLENTAPGISIAATQTTELLIIIPIGSAPSDSVEDVDSARETLVGDVVTERVSERAPKIESKTLLKK